eukprot:gene24716-biopygen17935
MPGIPIHGGTSPRPGHARKCKNAGFVLACRRHFLRHLCQEQQDTGAGMVRACRPWATLGGAGVAAWRVHGAGLSCPGTASPPGTRDSSEMEWWSLILFAVAIAFHIPLLSSYGRWGRGTARQGASSVKSRAVFSFVFSSLPALSLSLATGSRPLMSAQLFRCVTGGVFSNTTVDKWIPCPHYAFFFGLVPNKASLEFFLAFRYIVLAGRVSMVIP